jgi:hypothetical protein
LSDRSPEVSLLGDRSEATGLKMKKYLNVVANDSISVMRRVDHYGYPHIRNPPPNYVAGCDEPDLRKKSG